MSAEEGGREREEGVVMGWCERRGEVEEREEGVVMGWCECRGGWKRRRREW